MDHSLKLKLTWNKKGIRAQEGSFSRFWLWERKREERESTKLFYLIYEASLVRFRLANDKSSSHRQGVRWIPRTRDFVVDPRIEIWEIEVVGLRRLPTLSFTLQEVGILLTLVYFPLLGGLKGL